jgi:hypothetical protein
MVGMKHILDLSLQAYNTIVIILSVPHKHDLIKDSCVNREVEVFNRNLRNRLRCLRKVGLIEVPNERDLYTKHGQLLNSRGKEIMTNKIALTLENLVKRKVEPISIKWYDAVEIDRQKHQDQTTTERSSFDGTTSDVAHNAKNGTEGKDEREEKHEEEEEAEKKCEPLITADKEQELAPKRVKRQPVTRGNDFLWEL